MTNIQTASLIILAFLAGAGTGAAVVLAKWNIVLSDENNSLLYRIRNLSK